MQTIEQLPKCPKCNSEKVEQVGATKDRYILKCGDCKTFWSENKNE